MQKVSNQCCSFIVNWTEERVNKNVIWISKGKEWVILSRITMTSLLLSKRIYPLSIKIYGVLNLMISANLKLSVASNIPMELNYHLISGSFKDFVDNLILRSVFSLMWELNLRKLVSSNFYKHLLMTM